MSSADPIGAAVAAGVSGIETEAYEPTYIDYAEAFPPLAANNQPTGFGPAPSIQPARSAAPAVPNQWNKMSVRSTTLTSVNTPLHASSLTLCQPFIQLLQ
jgi:hypothetical protein